MSHYKVEMTLGGSVLLLLCLISLSAQAAETDGAHIMAGTTKVSGAVEVAAAASSNPSQARTSPFGGVALYVKPSLHVARERPNSLVSLDTYYGLRKYVNPKATPYDRFTDFDLATRVSSGMQAPIGLELRHRSGVQADPFGGYSGRSNTLHLHNNVDARAVFRVKTLRFYAGGVFEHDAYSSPDGSRDMQLSPGAVLGAKWLYFPRTAFVLDSSFEQVMTSGSSGGGSGRHIRVSGGIRSRASERTVGALTAGYGVGMYGGDNISGVHGLLLTASVSHDITPTRTLSAAYRKDFESAFFTNAVAYHSFEIKWSSEHGRALTSDLIVDPRVQFYKGAVTRTDVFVRTAGVLSYRISDNVQAQGMMEYRHRMSNGANVNFMDVGGRIGVKVSY